MIRFSCRLSKKKERSPYLKWRVIGSGDQVIDALDDAHSYPESRLSFEIRFEKPSSSK